MTAKIAVYGFGSMPVLQRHLIELARFEGIALEWCTILTQPHYRKIMREVLPPADILDVFEALPRVPQECDFGELTGYDGSFVEDMAAQKRQWRRLPGDWLLRRGIDYYRLYKDFLRRRGATHLLTSNIETPDGKIVVAAARELGMGIMAPVDLRNVTGTMFAGDATETPPSYARPTSRARAESEAILAAFREKWLPARAAPRDVDPASDDDTILAQHLPRFRARLASFAKIARERPDLFDPVYVRDAVMSNSKLMQKLIWGTRARINAPKYHIDHPSNLPSRFIFYPLQYTPESSINTPAPYFVDQFRVIDALRFAMPSDHLLVVKEHWSCLPLRPTGFMPRIMRLPGVVAACSTIPARAIIERASVTVSVTGTATLEACLAGRPALALGSSLPAWLLGGTTSLGDLRQALKQRIGYPLPDSQLVERLATLLDARYPFFWATPHMPGEPMLRRGNVRRMLSAIQDHLARLDTPTWTAVAIGS